MIKTYAVSAARTVVTRSHIRLRVLTVALLTFAMPGLAAAELNGKRGGTLEFAVTAEPENFDCHSATSFSFLHPIAPHYSTLLKFDPDNYPQVIGDLAESWNVSADHLLYSFKLRPNIFFHDGSRLTSTDVKASYERIIHPPPGIVSARQIDYAAISGIDTPDQLTLRFHLRWPEAAMLAGFASPWNCIYSAAKLTEDPHYPETHVLGSGPFVFAEYVKGNYWLGRRWERYYQADRPYLDGYRAIFMNAGEVMKTYQTGQIMAEFRGVTPAQRDQLMKSMGEKITIQETPWLSLLAVVFNNRRPPYDDVRVRRALSLAIDRWGAAQQLQESTFLKYVGGLMRPGSNMATPEADLVTIPGFSHDIVASRDEAKRLLAEAGVSHLALKLLVRDIPIPHYAGADLLAASWREIGVEITQERLKIPDWQKLVEHHDFDVALDFSGDFYDDPTLQLTKYVSQDLSPVDYSGSADRFLDALFIGQAMTPDQGERAKIVGEFERHALTEAYSVPLLWWNRIVATSSKVKGWHITPSHFIGQDLTDIWLDQ